MLGHTRLEICIKGVTNMKILEAPNMPLGFTLSLSYDLDAMHTFNNLPEEDQRATVNYIQESTSGEDAKLRIEEVVSTLHEGNSIV